MKDINELYTQFVITLETLSSTSKMTDEGIGEALEELEGDYYTFFHSDNVSGLFSKALISFDDVTDICTLRSKIQEIPADLLTVENYRASAEWRLVRDLADRV
jgi:hypothetical protein